jgi:hypothetical protein
LVFDFFAPKELKSWIKEIRQTFSKLSNQDILLLKQMLAKDEKYKDIFKKSDLNFDKEPVLDNKIEKYKEFIVSILKDKLK